MTSAPSRLPKLLRSPEELRQAISAARAASRSIGLVPTMGALHAGHLSLAKASAAECDLTVVTIFVNPKQFGEGEDYQRYPRDLDADLARLAEVGGELVVFAPPVDLVYPAGFDTRVVPGTVARPLEGRCRPGHFEGVATIVLKLFLWTPADFAYFGQKDYQQAVMIRHMVRDLAVPMQIRVCPTVRDEDGLALSSRNVYLSDEQRAQALSLSQSLQLAADLVGRGERDAQTILQRMRDVIEGAGDVRIDYVALADPQTLKPVRQVKGQVVALVAVRVGQTRLIDNQIIDSANPE